MLKVVLNLLLLLGCSAVFSQTHAQKEISIPVIFHVIYSDRQHSGSDGGNVSENLDTSKLLAELKDLHDDFLLQNSDTAAVVNRYKKRIGNPGITFFLADSIFQQGGERGIIRIKSKGNKRALYTKSPVIKPGKYLNVYIGNIGSSFCNTYSWNDEGTDAVYLAFDWVGQHYRLLTHETGHWFGLWHVFGGDGSGEGSGCSGDGDDIDDTPMQKAPTHGDCVECPPTVKDQTCDADVPSNYNNFMDYSGCRKMFTVEQSRKMRDSIAVHRPGLLTKE